MPKFKVGDIIEFTSRKKTIHKFYEIASISEKKYRLLNIYNGVNKHTANIRTETIRWIDKLYTSSPMNAELIRLLYGKR